MYNKSSAVAEMAVQCCTLRIVKRWVLEKLEVCIYSHESYNAKN